MIEELLKQTEEIIASNSTEDIKNLLSILKFSNISEEEQKAFDEKIFEKASINIHFHPDRISSNNLKIIDGLIESGEYKNQFQTKTSSGSLTAKNGGDRDIWENKLFNNFYGSNIEQRPKYGSLNLTYTSDGASPRFGSCFFVTTPEVKQRSTFTYGDSYLLPKERGIAKNLTQIYSKLYEDVFIRNTALGFQYSCLKDFIEQTTKSIESDILFDRNTHNLDFYIEAQIHGKIDLKKDISSLVVDYSFKGTELENQFMILCERYDISLIWNLGYELKSTGIPNNFRGVETQSFAKKVTENEVINAYIIGKALTSQNIKTEYEEFELLQLAKYLWHCLVKFGKSIKPVANKGFASGGSNGNVRHFL